MPKMDNLRLRAPLGPLMVERGLTVAALHERVLATGGRPWSRATIGPLRSNPEWTADPDLARRIAQVLDVPVSELFEPKRVAA